MYSPDRTHEILLSQKPQMAFDENGDFSTQKKQIREKLMELLGNMPEKVDPNPIVEYKKDFDDYIEYRIHFDVEEAVQAVCLLCIPKLGKDKYPLAICLQGHGKGMQVSLGRTYTNEPEDDGDRDIARQVMEQGYAALCLEQRGMGERRTVKVDQEQLLSDNGYPRCHVTAMNALLLGRTMIGERCWDVSRAIDMALTFPEISEEGILCTGNSGGGTTTFYAACLDERIAIAMPSCAVCSFEDSIGAMPHCVCNFVPKLAEYMDMGDMAICIAPRKLIVIHGKQDPIFPELGVRKVYTTIEKIYNVAGVPQNCQLATGKGGHRYYKREAWDAYGEVEGAYLSKEGTGK